MHKITERVTLPVTHVRGQSDGTVENGRSYAPLALYFITSSCNMFFRPWTISEWKKWSIAAATKAKLHHAVLVKPCPVSTQYVGATKVIAYNFARYVMETQALSGM